MAMIEMTAGRSWAGDAMRGFSSRRQRIPTKFWIIGFASFFMVILLFMSHEHLPDMPAYLTKGPPKPPSRRPPPPSHLPPKPAEGYPEDVKGPDGMRIWEPPVMDPLVHGTRVSESDKKTPKYPLDPFPYSPMTSPPSDDQQHPWLGAVICSAWDVKRRMLIRSTWMRLYKGVPMDQKFVISNPGRRWFPAIQQENRTYGDMIVLDHLHEDDFTANTVKTIEFYRWLVNKSPKKYEFVSKMDTDLWVNARGMYDNHILPRLEEKDSQLTSAVNHTIIGNFYYDGYHKTSFPHGAIYTVTWDIVQLLPQLQDQYNIIAGEDVTMAWLLMRAKQKVTMAVLNERQKFEFDKSDRRPGDDSAWARKETDVTSSWHALSTKDVVGVHQLKSDDLWLSVAECFDEQGLKDPPPFPDKPPKGNGDKPKWAKPYFLQIPDNFWETDLDGTLLCNGVWKLEPGVGRDMKKHT